jgi:cytochrome P450
VSRDAHRHWPTWIAGEIPPDWPLFTWVAVRNMFTAYGGEHRRLRTLVAGAFTARRTALLRPRIEEITAGLLDRIAEVGRHGAVVDLREMFAYPLPLQVISDLFGLPDTERAELRGIVASLFHTAADPDEVTATYARLYTVLGELVATKREAPGDDLTSALIAARDDSGGSRLSEQELLDTLSLLISAGHETTVNLLGNAVHALLTHPDQRDHVTAGRVSWDDVVEESLRHDAPVASVPMRYAVADIDLAGTLIRRGEPILIALAAAGRDPERYGPDADRFDATRADKDHLAFGHGVHHCLGAPLARLEARIALPALFARFPGLTLAGTPEQRRPVESFISNGRRALPVRLR